MSQANGSNGEPDYSQLYVYAGPDHVRQGKTLKEQIEGDHAYRDEPPEHDPSLWASHSLTCLVCGETFPAAPGGERRDRLDDGLIDTGTCPVCDRDVPVVEGDEAVVEVYVIEGRSWCCDSHGADTWLSGAYMTREEAEAQATGSESAVLVFLRFGSD